MVVQSPLLYREVGRSSETNSLKGSTIWSPSNRLKPNAALYRNILFKARLETECQLLFV